MKRVVRYASHLIGAVVFGVCVGLTVHGLETIIGHRLPPEAHSLIIYMTCVVIAWYLVDKYRADDARDRKAKGQSDTNGGTNEERER